MDIKLTKGPKTLNARAEFIAGVLWIHHDGRTFSHDPRANTKKKRKGAGAGDGSGDLEAPMPGKITKILKEAGQDIRRGEAVVVMEAMKMEYTLKAGADGKVEEIGCRVGDQVALGQTLVRLKGNAP